MTILSVVIPAYNEEGGIADIAQRVLAVGPSLAQAGVAELELLVVDEALDLLAKEDPAAAELVKLRYFVGMTMDEAATTMGIPLRSAERTWSYARAWLRRQIGDSFSASEM